MLWYVTMKVYRKEGQTKFIKNNMKGLLTLHDNGTIGVSVDHKTLFNGLEYEENGSYYVIYSPSTEQHKIIMDRLFNY